MKSRIVRVSFKSGIKPATDKFFELFRSADPKVGEEIGTGGIIAHGMLIMGFVGQLLSDYVGPTALRKFGVRFKGMTHLEDVITCTGTITNKYEADGEARIAGKVQAVDQNDPIFFCES